MLEKALVYNKPSSLYCFDVSDEEKEFDDTDTWTVLLFLMAAMAVFTSLGTTSPRYKRQQAMYLPIK
jgi:hypothetical protein